MKSYTREWTTAYLEFMMKEDFESGIDLKMQYFPKSFFKYRQLSEWTMNSITEGTIWLAEISSLNDPFECSLQFDNEECLRTFFADKKFQSTFKEKFGKKLSTKEIRRIIDSKEPYRTYSDICRSKGIILNITPDGQFLKAQRRWNEIIEETNKTIKISCFSETHDSLLMWSHYANEHKGICIEYDFLDNTEIRAFMQPIIYSEKIYRISLFEELTQLRKIGSSLIKSKDWEYEAEWRLTRVKQPHEKEVPSTITVPKPKAIYLGTRFHLNNESEQMRFFEILKEQNIPAYQMTKHTTEYKVIPQ